MLRERKALEQKTARNVICFLFGLCNKNPNQTYIVYWGPFLVPLLVERSHMGFWAHPAGSPDRRRDDHLQRRHGVPRGQDGREASASGGSVKRHVK